MAADCTPSGRPVRRLRLSGRRKVGGGQDSAATRSGDTGRRSYLNADPDRDARQRPRDARVANRRCDARRDVIARGDRFRAQSRSWPSFLAPSVPVIVRGDQKAGPTDLRAVRPRDSIGAGDQRAR
jgi:hypothetical protein